MKISCVIASYNQQEFLPEAVESALNQTVSFDEIIIVDDGSTDSSLEIAQKYTTYKSVKVISQVNKGLASARNTGVMNAVGKYILFLDSDDQLLENCLEKLMEKIQETDADVISPSFKTFGKDIRNTILMQKPTLEDFKQGNRVGYCSAIKRGALLEVGGYSPRMVKGYEDYHLWFNLLVRGKTFETIPEILWLYRTKENSMWTEAVTHHDELMAQIKKDFPAIYA